MPLGLDRRIGTYIICAKFRENYWNTVGVAIWKKVWRHTARHVNHLYYKLQWLQTIIGANRNLSQMVCIIYNDASSDIRKVWCHITYTFPAARPPAQRWQVRGGLSRHPGSALVSCQHHRWKHSGGRIAAQVASHDHWFCGCLQLPHSRSVPRARSTDWRRHPDSHQSREASSLPGWTTAMRCWVARWWQLLTNYSTPRTTWPESSARAVVASTPGCCFACYTGFQWGSKSPIKWLYWLTKCEP